MSASDRPPRRVDAHSADEVLHRAGQADAADQPDQAGRIAELRRQHRADQRTGAGDRGEMVAEQHPSLRRDSSWSRRTSCAPASRARRRATITLAAMNAL